MSLVLMSTLYPDIVPFVAGCPSPIVRHALRHAAREFCIETRAWRANLTAMNAVATQSDYVMVAPNSSAAILEVASVRYADEPLDFMTEAQLDNQFPKWRTDTGLPLVYTILVPGTITLVPQPVLALASAISIRAVLIPSTTAVSLDDSITIRWMPHLAAGALARLVVMPNQPWTAPAMAEVYEGYFRDGMRKAKTAASSSFQSHPRRTVAYGGI